MTDRRLIAYFSMEIGLESEMPTYAGGLGALAGDTIRSAADLKIPLVAVSLVHRRGYFFQRFDESGWQVEEPVRWAVDDYAVDTGLSVEVTLEGRPVRVGAWRYDVKGVSGYTVPVFLLDTDRAENTPEDRGITHYLYGGDHRYRLFQEVVLGIGGVRMLRTLDYDELERFHMNEGHASLLSLELLREECERAGRSAVLEDDIQSVRRRCVFTTHTPVAAGHDQFPWELAERVIGPHVAWSIRDQLCHVERLNTTYLALCFSHYVNGVAKKHGEVSRHMFAGYQIDSITNGIHVATWACAAFADLFDRRIAGWREDNFMLRYAVSLSDEEIRAAHRRAKRELVEYVNEQTNCGFDHDVLTIGFARRAAAYKRADLLLADLERLRRMVKQAGRIQVVYGGKAHPNDREGKLLIQRVFKFARELNNDVPIAYLANYDMRQARLMTSGVDVWLNTPEPPMEASGTSGMKAAVNGVPSLSVLDGWWIEGWIENTTGWAIDGDSRIPGAIGDRSHDAASLYSKLEEVIIPMYYRSQKDFIDIQRNAIALNGSFFNTSRMMQQYVVRAYF